MNKIIYITFCLLVFNNLVFSQQSKNVSIKRNNQDPIYDLSSSTKNNSTEDTSAIKIGSNDIPQVIFTANAGIDIVRPILSASFNVLVSKNASLGIGYRHWIVQSDNTNGLSLNFKMYKITTTDKLSAFGVDAGTTFRIDNYSSKSSETFINMYSSSLFLSPNYLLGVRLYRNLFLTLNAKLDIMISPNYVIEGTVINPGISAGLLF